MSRLQKPGPRPRLPRDLLLPKTSYIPEARFYRPVDANTASWTKEHIEALWHLKNITKVSLPTAPNNRRNPFEAPVFRIETSAGKLYEFTIVSTRDLAPGAHLLREIFSDGSRGEWEEGPFLQEYLAAIEKERNESLWAQPRKPLTRERKAAISGLRELDWMDLDGLDVYHASAFWLSLGEPDYATEAQKERILRKWRDHAKICEFNAGTRVCEKKDGAL
ncbi:hypothetical protein BJ508DRAFT_418045 [Ascobolus immersus RN42]|uniref:Uncharacterized protein n=1 Tax=Ascobolus immersus RN42 TaxID=1160509 RepID=A0A3N4HU96_ASCIM|nr:hypothetical protein BJ508DRAFT_418045 [Ascobolus immersus RN42]